MSAEHPTYEDILGLEVPASVIRRHLDAQYGLNLYTAHLIADNWIAFQDAEELLADTGAEKTSIRLGPHRPIHVAWEIQAAEMQERPTVEECGILLLACMSEDWCYPAPEFLKPSPGQLAVWEKAYYDAAFAQPPPNRSCQRYVNDMPIPMILNCPACGARHVDKGEFAKKEHRDHACQACGVVWRPSLCYTVGVQFLPGYKDPE